MLFLNIKNKRFLIEYVMESIAMKKQNQGVIGPNSFKCILKLCFACCVNSTNVDEILIQDMEKAHFIRWINSTSKQVQ